MIIIIIIKFKLKIIIILITIIFKKIKKNNNNVLNPNLNYRENKEKRESSKNHAYHEINLTHVNKAKTKLSSNSLSHYYSNNEPNDELNTSNNTYKYSVTSNNSDRHNTIKYSTNSLNQKSRKMLHKNNNIETNGEIWIDFPLINDIMSKIKNIWSKKNCYKGLKLEGFKSNKNKKYDYIIENIITKERKRKKYT